MQRCILKFVHTIRWTPTCFGQPCDHHQAIQNTKARHTKIIKRNRNNIKYIITSARRNHNHMIQWCKKYINMSCCENYRLAVGTRAWKAFSITLRSLKNKCRLLESMQPSLVWCFCVRNSAYKIQFGIEGTLRFSQKITLQNYIHIHATEIHMQNLKKYGWEKKLPVMLNSSCEPYLEHLVIVGSVSLLEQRTVKLCVMSFPGDIKHWDFLVKSIYCM